MKIKVVFPDYDVIDIVTDASTLRRKVYKPSFYRGMPISEDLAIVQCRVQTLMLNRPVYVDFTVLELSKLHMYDFHYNHMKAKYPHAGQLKLLFTNTDSLAYAVKTDSIYEDMAVDAVSTSTILVNIRLITHCITPQMRKHWGISRMS